MTLVASAGGAWWTARMPEGRDSLMAILKRLDGRYIPDPSPDRITEFEAMRIEEYQDEAMAWQVKRRFDNYGAVGSERDSRGVRPADAVTSDPRHDPRGGAHAGPRGAPARQLPQPDHAGADEARDRVDGRHQGPQVDGARLPGLRLRRPDEVHEGRDPRLPPAQRADLLHRHPWAPGSARGLHRRLRPPDRGPGRGGGPRRPLAGGRGRRGPGPRHGRLRGQELERPLRRDQPRVERVEGVLPPRVQPDRPAPGRQVPQDRGQGPAAEVEGPERARPAGVLRSPRGPVGRERGRASAIPPSATRSTRRSRSRTCRCASRASSSTRSRSTR